MTGEPLTDRKAEALKITERWRTDLAYTPPEAETWRWHIIAEELADLLAREDGSW